jgi:hypothetical protein
MAIFNVIPPKGFEFIGDMPHSAMNDGSVLLVRFDIKRIEQSQEDPHAELKAQYALDVEACETITDLDAFELWQCESLAGHFVNRTATPPFYDTVKYRRHPHADSIIAYHKCSEEDKARLEMSGDGENWMEASKYPDWTANYYRLPPKPFFIGKHEVPPPVTEPLEFLQEYWLFNLIEIMRQYWTDDDVDLQRMSECRIRLTEQDARTCFEALQKTLKGE